MEEVGRWGDKTSAHHTHGIQPSPFCAGTDYVNCVSIRDCLPSPIRRLWWSRLCNPPRQSSWQAALCRVRGGAATDAA